MNSHLGAIENIACQTLPNHPCKFGTFVRKITLYSFFFALREPTNTHPVWTALLSICETQCFSMVYATLDALLVRHGEQVTLGDGCVNICKVHVRSEQN